MRVAKKNRGVFEPWRGVFETLRVERGEAQFAAEHAESLRRSAAVLGLRLRQDFHRLRPPIGTGRWRWVVTADQSTAFFQPQSRRIPRQYSLSISPLRVGRENWDARYKTISYLTHWQARQQATTDEVILLNEDGEIASGAMSNVFWVKNRKIYTPAVDCGCRAGIIRAQIMKLYPVQEIHASAGALQQADQIFLTNSWIGLKPARLRTGRGHG